MNTFGNDDVALAESLWGARATTAVAVLQEVCSSTACFSRQPGFAGSSAEIN